MAESIFLDTLRGVHRERPPVWFMRQAGRCLASYNKLRETHSFMELMETPNLAAEVTLMPVHELGVDAAILFSDILVIPQALGMELSFDSGGPKFKTALKDVEDPAGSLRHSPRRLDHVYAAIDEIMLRKPAGIPLIGFCGGPLTVMCYMMQGLGSNHTFPDALRLLRENRPAAKALLEKITDASVEYAQNQVKHGIQAFQLFETWAGLIPADEYMEHVMPWSQKILSAVRSRGVPTIFFPRLFGEAVCALNSDATEGVSLDQTMALGSIRSLIDPDIVLQGNLDPELLLQDWDTIETALGPFSDHGRSDDKWIFNLGHGVLPATPETTLKKLVAWIKDHDWQR